MMRDKIKLLLSHPTMKIQFKQKAVLVLGSVAVGSLLMYLMMPKSNSQNGSSDMTKTQSVVTSGNRNIKPQEVWVDRLEKEREFLSKRVEIQTQKDPISKPPDGFLATVAEPDIKQIQGEIRHLAQQDLEQPKSPHQPLPQEPMQTPPSSKPPSSIRRFQFQLNAARAKKIGHTVDHYVPAGSFVSGILTSGVVAKTSVDSSSNPQPVHIEVTSLGTLPRNFQSDLKSCFVIGAAYGDLAAERAFIRLEKLSCVERKTGETIETSVDGYVVGEDGANGLRGLIVDRSGPAVRNAFMGGLISGVGHFFANQQNSPLAVTTGGLAAINPMGSKQALEAGASRGVSSAMEKYADFYIKRAEQLQPVIEIESGRQVDIVFQKGFDLNQTLFRRSLIERREKDVRDVSDDQFIRGANDR